MSRQTIPITKTEAIWALVIVSLSIVIAITLAGCGVVGNPFSNDEEDERVPFIITPEGMPATTPHHLWDFQYERYYVHTPNRVHKLNCRLLPPEAEELISGPVWKTVAEVKINGYIRHLSRPDTDYFKQLLNQAGGPVACPVCKPYYPGLKPER